MDTAVIVSTYNSPAALRMTLLGFAAQENACFELLVADDGSDQRTRDVLADPQFVRLRLQHVWQEDHGFRLSAIRNRAIRQTNAEYLIFSDGDCVPRRDFVASHQRLARRSCFLSGARIEIPSAVHPHFKDEQILSNQIFDPHFLVTQASSLRRYRGRLSHNRWWQTLMNFVTWRYCVFCGSNASAWRHDLLGVNGFDESFRGYGSEDRDLGIRLRNSGIRSRYLKYSLCQLHLDHPRSYADPEIERANREVFLRRRHDGTTRIAHGIDSSPGE